MKNYSLTRRALTTTLSASLLALWATPGAVTAQSNPGFSFLTKVTLKKTDKGFIIILPKSFQLGELEDGAKPVLTLSPFAEPGPKSTEDFLLIDRLKALSGEQTYALPAGFDPEKHRSIVVWCETFARAMGYFTFDLEAAG